MTTVGATLVTAMVLLSLPEPPSLSVTFKRHDIRGIVVGREAVVRIRADRSESVGRFS